MYRSYKHGRLLFSASLLSIIVLGVGSVITYHQINNENWDTRIFRVQFDDESLEGFNGCYERNFTRKERSRRHFYGHDGNNTMNAEFGFCLETQQWFLYEKEEGKDIEPCDFIIHDDNNGIDKINETEVKIFSGNTLTFDIETVFLEDWFTGDGTPADLFFFEEIQQREELYCNAFIGNGICDHALNKKSFNYDGGDCCAATCSHGRCGAGQLDNPFGSSGKVGYGYASCEDDSMVPITIELGSFTNSRELHRNKTLPLSDAESAYIEQYNPQYYNETPNDVLMQLDCDGDSVLKLYLDESMQGKSQTVHITDEANCILRFSNSTKSADFLDSPIWYIDYTVYMGKENDDKRHGIYSNNTRYDGNATFERPPECALKQMKKHREEGRTRSPLARRALEWLFKTTESKNGKCVDNFIELFALAALNFAAPSYEGELWIQKGKVCDWSHVDCVGTFTSVNETLDLLELDIGNLNLTGSIPTEIGLLSNLVKYDICESKSCP